MAEPVTAPDDTEWYQAYELDTLNVGSQHALDVKGSDGRTYRNEHRGRFTFGPGIDILGWRYSKPYEANPVIPDDVTHKMVEEELAQPASPAALTHKMIEEEHRKAVRAFAAYIVKKFTGKVNYSVSFEQMAHDYLVENHYVD